MPLSRSNKKLYQRDILIREIGEVGQAMTFNRDLGSFFSRCLIPEKPPDKEFLAAKENGVLGVLPGILGLIEANEAIKRTL